LNVFLHIDRVLARDFSIMIQSVGMSSASIFILSHKDTVLRDYKPLIAFIPVCFAGFLLGMKLLQQMHVYLIQAFFLCLSATFVIAYFFSDHRGAFGRLAFKSKMDHAYLGLVLVLGGMLSSLFGTGADIVLYTLLVTHFAMTAKVSTRMSIVLQAAISILGYGYRAFFDHGLTDYQIRTWLCAYPVVLFMAPFGAHTLSRLHVNWMLKAIIVINIFQLLYFNLTDPSAEKLIASAVFTVVLSAVFYLALRHMAGKSAAVQA
ncbi:MAG: sulfite exporter TauE/SafE family protein, partial [Steroidobacteraceae bacterium]